MSVTAVRSALREYADESRAEFLAGFFKTATGEYGEGDRFLGIRVPDIRRVARQFRTLGEKDLERLLQSRWHEERVLALIIMVTRFRRVEERESLKQLYLRQLHRVNNWDLVDLSAPHILGGCDPSLLVRFAKSDSVWERRIAMLATFHDIRRREFDLPLRIATMLIADPHPLIHKAVGWMLREIGNRDLRVEERFVSKHRTQMPKTMLRYATEKWR